jgi:hypothetical protein
MPTGTGYIYFWRAADGVGRIRVCSGSFADLNVPFEQQDCDAALQATLSGMNINRPRECPPPAGALRVRFGFIIRDGAMFATNIVAI